MHLIKWTAQIVLEVSEDAQHVIWHENSHSFYGGKQQLFL